MSQIIKEDELDRLIAEHEKQSGALKSAMGGDNCWDAGIEIVKSCGVLFDLKYSIVLSVLADEKIKRLMRVFPNLEWLGYLVGEVNHERSNVYVEDIIIPKQRVSSGAVTNVEYEWNEGLPIIGVIHSHHGMGAFFSGTDDAYINQNHDVSIVVATRPGNEIKAQVRVKAQCGKFYICERITFAVNAPFVLDVGAFMQTIRDNIFTNVMRYTPVYPAYITPSNIRRTIGGVNTSIAERVSFKPFVTDDLEFDDGDDYTIIDEEGEDEDSLIVDLDEVDRLMKDVEHRESWTSMVERQAELIESKEQRVNIPIENGDSEEDKSWVGSVKPQKKFEPFTTVDPKFEEQIRQQRLGWLIKPSTVPLVM